jgi:predicted transposase YbfD/YdcC
MAADTNSFDRLIAAYSNLKDPRIERSKLYPLNEIVFLCISAVISGFQDWDEIVDFGIEKIDWLRKYLPYEHGIPSHDTVNRVISLLDYRVFETCFINWTTMDLTLPSGVQICIDGKSLRGSATKMEQQLPHNQGGKSAVHIVHAWCNDLEICLGQYKTEAKSNEITAIPALLELLEIGGTIVTIDAMGCQKTIAKAIIGENADYIFGLKDNQEVLSLCAFAAFNPEGLVDETLFIKETQQPLTATAINEKNNHGRKETRTCRTLKADALSDYANAAEWSGLKTIIEITATREILATGKVEKETRYYISSLDKTPEDFNTLIRSHWGVENKLHWTLDVTMGEDQSRKQIRNAAQNFSTFRKIALNMLKANPEKISINRKQNKCAMSDQYREKTMRF